MDIEKHLQKLKHITPDAEYARHSRARLLASGQPLPRFTLRTFLVGALQSGSAIALTGLLLFLITRGFSPSKVLGPVVGLNTDSLHAEAQAIDMQIQLADLQYQDAVSGRPALIAPSPSPSLNPTAAAASAADLPASTPAEATTSASGSGSDTTAATSTPTSTVVGVDQVLNILSR